MNLNIILRGQSNALLFGMADNWAMLGKLTQDVQRLLGFDGSTDKVTVHYAYGEGNGAYTLNSGTAFLGDWIGPTGGDWRNGWTVKPLEQGILDYIRGLPADLRDDPTAVLWYHSEYDSQRGGLTPAEWESGVRFDAGLVRAALGQSAATVPYLFVSAHPYTVSWGRESDAGHQAIRQGMENLASDAGFNADIAARVLDINANYHWGDGSFGGEHLSDSDQGIAEGRMARALAETWASYAKPGSPVANAGGNIDDQGPKVTAAMVVGTNQLSLRFAFDGAGRLQQALDPDAARGVGWTVRSGADVIAPTAAALSGTDGLLLTFNAAIPAGGKLFYGYGYGRLAEGNTPGQGNAVYDDQGMPVWVEANGLSVTRGSTGGTGTATPPPPPPATSQPISATIGTGTDKLVLSISQDAYQGSAQYTVQVDGRQIGGTLTASALRSTGQSDTVTVQGDWAGGAHTATVTFLNDAWGGSASADRNLYVNGATYNGVALPNAIAALEREGPARLAFTDTDPVAPGPQPPTTQPSNLTIGTGPDKLVLSISQDAYQGNAQYTVQVDGARIGGTLTASALRSAGQHDTVTVQGDWAGGRHTATVTFLNDAWGGTAATDRNLYLDGATYNGASLSGARASLMSAGPANVGFTDSDPVASNPSFPPASQTVGTGPDKLVLLISQDAYQGSAQYTVRVDGVQIGGTLTASALQASGQHDTVTIQGNWGQGNHTVAVAFLNDAWGGTVTTDRNLHLESATYNGTAVSGATADLMSNGSAGFSFLDPLV